MTKKAKGQGRKSTDDAPVRKLALKKDALKDLSPSKRAKTVKGGALGRTR